LQAEFIENISENQAQAGGRCLGILRRLSSRKLYGRRDVAAQSVKVCRTLFAADAAEVAAELKKR
jgi:hypothetical protein